MALWLNLGQHCIRWWVIAWLHLAIIWSNVDLTSVRSPVLYVSLFPVIATMPSTIWNAFRTNVYIIKFSGPWAAGLPTCLSLSELGKYWFRYLLGDKPLPRKLVCCQFEIYNIFQQNCTQNETHIIHGNAFEVVDILFRLQYVKHWWWTSFVHTDS